MKDQLDNQPENGAEGNLRYEVPPGGSLGLLALGSVGVRAWRKARDEYYEANPSERPNYREEWDKLNAEDE